MGTYLHSRLIGISINENVCVLFILVVAFSRKSYWTDFDKKKILI